MNFKYHYYPERIHKHNRLRGCIDTVGLRYSFVTDYFWWYGSLLRFARVSRTCNRQLDEQSVNLFDAGYNKNRLLSLADTSPKTRSKLAKST